MTIELMSRAAYAVAKERHRRSKGRPGGASVVVFSMAKTGSSAVVAGLRGAGVRGVFHVHDLDPVFLAGEEAEYRWSGRPWRVWDAQVLLQRPPTTTAPWRVVSIVRDPIARVVSAFFQPGVRRGYLTPGVSVDVLTERFGDRLDHLGVGWFDSHVLPSLGIDVFAHAFDLDARYQIIRTPEVHLLLLRCEDLEVAPTALAGLLDLDGPIDVPHVNVAAEKEYADAYTAFTEALEPTPKQLERAYSSRMVQHFYSPVEVDRLRSRWTEPRGEPAR